MKRITRLMSAMLIALMLQGCTGMIVGAATSATIAAAKVPFKVGGAVIGAVRHKGDKE